MKRLLQILLCIVLVISLSLAVYAATSVPEPVIEATESVVRVLSEYADGYATGSGFVIKSDSDETLIATNYHVVDGNPYSISVWLSEDETVSATILAYTKQKDMCILKLAYPVSLSSLVFSELGATQGAAVYAVGFPGAADYLSDKEAHTSADATITDGIVSAVREATVSSYGTPTKILQINAAINSGNSGGPLFNADGEVVGINTYGINDAQGIFGAIDVSELKAFVQDNAISVPVKEAAFPWLLVAVILAFAVCSIAIIVVVRKKKMNTPKQTDTETKNVSLREYMSAHPEGIDLNNAVAMLLPVALQLRDLHNNGNAHLQVSPNTISVCENGAILAKATTVEADRYTSGYAAPEIYRGSSAGNLSDIYSFCAVLSYVVSGTQPINALTRTESDEITNEDSIFAQLINGGMALDATDRLNSMQEIIIKLSSYNTRPFVNELGIAQSASTMSYTKKRKPARKKFAIVIVSVLILALALVGAYGGCYFAAKANAKNGEFATADRLLFVDSITKLHDAELVTYIEAGLLMEARNYGDAKLIFDSISGYLNATELEREADYRHAAQYADANEFDEAINIMSALEEKDYKDAADKVLEFQYRKGIFLLFEEENFVEATEIFAQLAEKNYEGAEDMKNEAQYLWACSLLEEKNFVEATEIFTQLAKINYDGAEDMLKESQYLWACSLVEAGDYVGAYKKLEGIKGYLDVNNVLFELEEVIYAEGQSLYHIGKYDKAREYFSCIPGYADSGEYTVLIAARDAIWTYPEGAAKVLTDLFYFEDASELLVSSTDVACYFLLGNWTTSNGSYYFKIEFTEDKSNFWNTYNLPWYGGTFSIVDGIYSVSNDSYTDKPQFRITLLTPDSMEVYCYKNGSTYTLYR